MTLRRIVLVAAALAALAGCELFLAPQNEGSPSDPVVIYVGVPYQGSIAGWGTSYYTFVPFATGSHTIALTSTDSDLGWDLYDSTWDWITGCDDWGFAADEIATAGLTEGQTYYLSVDEYDWEAGNFSILVTFP